MHFLDESFWLAVSFIIFAYLAYKPAKRAILNSLDAKIAQVKSLVAEAENLRKDAANILLKTQDEIKNLSNLRVQILDDARSDAKLIAETRAAEMQEQLEQKKKDAFESINQQQINTYNNIKQDFARLTMKLAEEYLKETDNNNSSDIEIAENFIKKGPNSL